MAGLICNEEMIGIQLHTIVSLYNIIRTTNELSLAREKRPEDVRDIFKTSFVIQVELEYRIYLFIVSLLVTITHQKIKHQNQDHVTCE